MTKAELIRKIAKRAGVPDSEAKVFFEIFLKKSSELLAPGQAVLLKGFGHFQFKKGKIRTEASQSGQAGRESIFVDLMAYYPARQLEGEISDNLIFNIPSLQFENFNSIDSFFSLSFGKPVIPLKGVKVNEIFIPLTGLELRNLIEAKVDKLVKELEIIKEYTKGSEVLIIDPESVKSHQLEFNWGEIPSGDISGSRKSYKKTDGKVDKVEGSDISWDFGADISKQIEEDSILDVDKTDEHLISEENDEDDVSWDFGASTIDGPVELSEDENLIFMKPAENQDKKITERFEKIEPDEDEEHFERVMPISSGLLDGNETVEEENLHWDTAQENKAEYDKFEPESKITLDEDEEKPELNETDKTVQFNDDFEKLDSEENIVEDEVEVNEESNESIDIESVQKEPDESEPEEPELNTFSASTIIEKRKEREAYYSRRGTSPIFIIALVIIIAVGVTVYLFLRSTFSSKEIPGKESSANIAKVEPEIIERNFKIPVTYPYNKVENGTKPAISSITPKLQNQVKTNNTRKPVNNNSVPPGKTADKNKSENQKIKDSNLIEKTKSKVDPGNPSTFTFENLPLPADSTKVGNNVSSDRGSFTVQVSSWKSRTIALEQLAKFISKGYDAFIEKANIPEKGTWYRVKVRNFKTQKEAEDFLKSNQH
ncbi:MAG: SPOR domain-containing protein [Ignavibacteriaceae bacterium]